jgi:glucose-6-phosphate 1-dehydrogenase
MDGKGGGKNMKPYRKADPCTVVIFGAGGDLTGRKLVPALYNLYFDGWLPEELAIVGVDIRKISDDNFRTLMRKKTNTFSRRGKVDEAVWKRFAKKIHYVAADFNDASAFRKLCRLFGTIDKELETVTNKIFYLAIPPSMIETVAEQLGEVNLADDLNNRMVVEKPFGRDLDSAQHLNSVLQGIFRESQIYRIDHYLGKETVQNIFAFRFANSMFEPIWNRRYIDHIQITVAEDIGVEHRGGYYEQAGALRDMVQNHLLQLMSLIAMELPISFDADEIRNRKVDVLRAIREIPPEEVHKFAVRGQYGPGWEKGNKVKSYRKEPGVAPNSNVETFAAVKLHVDNWRWQEVPFYLRTGKRLPSRVSEVVIQFRPVPHQSFPSAALVQPEPNRLIMRIHPTEGILLRFMAKKPGEVIQLTPVDMRFTYREAFKSTPPEAYETLLLDVMLGDFTQFMRADQLETAWSIINPILNVWESVEPDDFPNYASGSWGPEEAEVLIAQDGRTWRLPSVMGPEEKFNAGSE